jgi:hypothetical protein
MTNFGVANLCGHRCAAMISDFPYGNAEGDGINAIIAPLIGLFTRHS